MVSLPSARPPTTENYSGSERVKSRPKQIRRYSNFLRFHARKSPKNLYTRKIRLPKLFILPILRYTIGLRWI